MVNLFRLSCCLALLFIFFAAPFHLKAQSFSTVLKTHKSVALANQFSTYQVFQLDAKELDTYVKSNAETPAQIQIGNHQWQLALTHNRIVSENYSLQVSTPQGIITTYPKTNIAYKGYELNGGGKVRLTIHGEFLYGFVEEGIERYYIEPLWYFEPGASHDLFVLYPRSSVRPLTTKACGFNDESMALQHLENRHEKGTAIAEMSTCYELDFAIASDRSMFDKYGSVGEVENHNIGVINDVQVDFTGSFNHDLAFVIVTQFVVTGNDPWTNSLDATALLTDFRAWGNNGGFGVSFDNAELWTNRIFFLGIQGLAYLNGVCNTEKYHLITDVASTGETLRALTSHELGHNFSCQHELNCTPVSIMCPFLSDANIWSQGSTDAINGYMQSKINSGCLTSCPIPPPPVAGFDWQPNPSCQNESISFTNLSTGNIDFWAWTFQGGNPDTSSLQDPTVTWNTAGNKTITLTATGPGGSNTLTKIIEILPLTVANFTHVVNVRVATFTNTSVFATTYDWDFGDGTSSTEVNPIHEYADPGNYTVVLTTTNFCGTSTKSIEVVTAPVANFVGSPLSGCSGLVATMENQSSYNATSFLWSFPGGIPSTSNQTNPAVLYSIAGTFPITLTASNISGSDIITRTAYVTIKATPTAKFTTSINGSTVTFTNTTIGNSDAYSWNFGDGNSSSLSNPIHTYAVSGTYEVILTASNACGSSTKSQIVTVESTIPPTTAFTATPLAGCAPLTVNFTNNTTGAVSYQWTFPGGIPDSSTVANPTVVFNSPQTYTATLIASNPNGRDTALTTITANTVPTAGFTYGISNDTTVSFANASNGATSFLWTFGDGDSSVVANPAHDYPANDSIYVYQVIMRAINDCGMISDTQAVAIITDPKAKFTASPKRGCAPFTVQFNNESTPNTTAFLWRFPGGVPDTSILKNPVVVYATPDTFTVTFIASNASGRDTLIRSNFIVVNTVPTAAFTSAANGLDVTFTNNTLGATSYAWDFGDGDTSTVANPSHAYATSGTYTVILSAFNDCGTVTQTQSLTVTTAPSAGFTASVSSGCAPLTVQFTNSSSSNATSFDWQFPGGTPSSTTEQTPPAVTYSVPGTYLITLTVSNNEGSSTFTQSIVVTDGPSADFSATVSGLTATFTNSTSDGISYFWDFGDGGSSSEANPMHEYTAGGTYTVILTAANDCGTSTFTQDVNLIIPPVAGFSVNANSGCSVLSVNFTDISSGSPVGWAWSFPGGAPGSSSDQNPTVEYFSPGVYEVTLTAFNAAGSSSSTTTITVNTVPTAGFTYQIGGLTAIFNNLSINGTSYAWDFGDGSTSSTAANPTHIYSQTGIYIVLLSATNACGTVTTTQIVQVEGAPPAPAISANNTVGCLPFSVQFMDQSTGDPTAWSWTFQGGMPAGSTEQNPLVNYSAPGTYDVVLQATNVFGTATQSFPGYITVQPPPTAGFTYVTNQLTVNFTSIAQNASTYSWSFGDGGSSTDQNPIHTYTNPGTYNVFLSVSNNCGTFVIEQVVVITSGTNEASWIEGFRLFPNPNTGSFTVEMNGIPQDEVEFVLFNMLSQPIRRETIDFGTGSMLRNFDYDDLGAGIYTLRIQAGGASFFIKIMVGR